MDGIWAWELYSRTHKNVYDPRKKKKWQDCKNWIQIHLNLFQMYLNRNGVFEKSKMLGILVEIGKVMKEFMDNVWGQDVR